MNVLAHLRRSCLVGWLFGHIHSFITFYVRSQELGLESAFSLPVSVQRILALNGPSPVGILKRLLAPPGNRGEVRVHVSKPRRPEKNPFRIQMPEPSEKRFLRSTVTVGCAHHTRSNILHLFTGRFEEKGDRCILRGQLGLDPGIRIVLGFFCAAILLVAPTDMLVHGGFIWKDVAPMLVFWLILESMYLFGKNDDAIITRCLSGALAPTAGS